MSWLSKAIIDQAANKRMQDENCIIQRFNPDKIAEKFSLLRRIVSTDICDLGNSKAMLTLSIDDEFPLSYIENVMKELEKDFNCDIEEMIESKVFEDRILEIYEPLKQKNIYKVYIKIEVIDKAA